MADMVGRMLGTMDRRPAPVMRNRPMSAQAARRGGSRRRALRLARLDREDARVRCIPAAD